MTSEIDSQIRATRNLATKTDGRLSELKELSLAVARVVSSVHGVLTRAEADRLGRLQAEMGVRYDWSMRRFEPIPLDELRELREEFGI